MKLQQAEARAREYRNWPEGARSTDHDALIALTDEIARLRNIETATRDYVYNTNIFDDPSGAVEAKVVLQSLLSPVAGHEMDSDVYA